MDDGICIDGGVVEEFNGFSVSCFLVGMFDWVVFNYIVNIGWFFVVFEWYIVMVCIWNVVVWNGVVGSVVIENSVIVFDNFIDMVDVVVVDYIVVGFVLYFEFVMV